MENDQKPINNNSLKRNMCVPRPLRRAMSPVWRSLWARPTTAAPMCAQKQAQPRRPLVLGRTLQALRLRLGTARLLQVQPPHQRQNV